jgi:hypothetical protein
MRRKRRLSTADTPMLLLSKLIENSFQGWITLQAYIFVPGLNTSRAKILSKNTYVNIITGKFTLIRVSIVLKVLIWIVLDTNIFDRIQNTNMAIEWSWPCLTQT